MCETNPGDGDSAGVWEGALTFVCTYPRASTVKPGMGPRDEIWPLEMDLLRSRSGAFSDSPSMHEAPSLTMTEMDTLTLCPTARCAVEGKVSCAAAGATLRGVEKWPCSASRGGESGAGRDGTAPGETDGKHWICKRRPRVTDKFELEGPG